LFLLHNYKDSRETKIEKLKTKVKDEGFRSPTHAAEAMEPIDLVNKRRLKAKNESKR
jgi:hypothetical protein